MSAPPSKRRRVEAPNSPTHNVVSDEELNFWKIYLACYKLATESVRIYFHTQIPKSSLESHLSKWKTQLDPSLSKRTTLKCYPDQFNILFPAAPNKVCSSKFDFSLLYKLIRNTIPKLPTYTWGQELANLGSTDLDDIERIRHYRNELAHNTNMAISDTDFQLRWSCLSIVVSRLSNNTLNSEVQELEKQTLNLKTRDEALEDMKRDLELERERISNLQQEVDEHERILRDHDKKFTEQEKKNGQHETKLKDHDETLKKLSNSIPENVKRQTSYILANWKIDDKVFCSETRAYNLVVDTIESGKITVIIGGPGAGKSATAHHIALEYETKGWEVIPVTSLKHVIKYANPTQKQVFLIDDLFGVYTPEMNVYNTFRKCREKLEKGQGRDFKLLLTSRKSVFKHVMGKCDAISIVDIDSHAIALNINEKKKILINHCEEKEIKKGVYEHLDLSTQFMFPLLCSQFVSNKNYQECGERFFTKPYECIIEELDRLKSHNQIQYAALVLCLLSEDELEDIHEVTDELKTGVINRCCETTAITDKAIAKALSDLTGLYITQTDKHFTFIHDSIEEIVGYHFGQNNIDLMLKYMSCSFVWGTITLSKELKNDDLCIEVDEKYYRLLAKRMYEDIQDKVISELFDVFRNKSISHAPFAENFMEVVDDSGCESLLELLEYKEVDVLYCADRTETFIPNDVNRRTQMLLIEERIDGSSSYYGINIMNWILFYGHTNLLKCLFGQLDRRNISTKKWLADNFDQGRLAMVACCSGSIQLVKTLFGYIDKACYLKDNSLILAACTTGNIELIRYLENFGARNNLSGDDDDKHSPLSVASYWGHLTAVKYLAQKDKDGDHRNMALCKACFMGHIDIVRHLVEIGANVNFIMKPYTKSTPTLTPFNLRTCEYSFLRNKFLEERSTPYSIGSQSPLYNAARQGHIDIVNFLLEKDANVHFVDYQLCSVLFETINSNRLIDKDDNERRLQIAKSLIAKNVDINICNLNGESPLYIASKQCHKKMIDLLAGQGADFSVRTDKGETPIINALLFNKPDIVQILVKGENGRNMKTKPGNIRLYDSTVALRQASIIFDGWSKGVCISDDEMISIYYDMEFYTALEQLVKVGFDINKCNEFGESLLLVFCGHYISSNSHFLYDNFTKMFHWFVKNGADVNYRNDKNENVRDRVRRWKDMKRWDGCDLTVDVSFYDDSVEPSFHEIIEQYTLGFPYIRTALEFVEMWNFLGDRWKVGLRGIKKHFRRKSI